MLGGKLKEGETARHSIAQVYPVKEVDLHNFTEPSRCFCFPVIYEYAGLDGQVDFITVEHRWIQ